MASGIVVHQNVAVDGALHWVTDVVNEKIVAIAPMIHIEVTRRSPIVMPERLVVEQITSAGVHAEPEGVTSD